MSEGGAGPAPEADPTRIAVDTGGTFTDVVVARRGAIEVKKVPSRPDAPEKAIVDAVADILASDQPGAVVHGTTIATNALLSRSAAGIALVTTSGFEDLLEIGRQNRPSLYDLNVRKPPPLVPRELIFGVEERTLHTGEVLTPLSEASLDELVQKLEASGVESVAVCFLFSYANPNNERAVRDALSKLDVVVSLSSDILPAYREFERLSTTVINAYVAPTVTRYLSRLRSELGDWHVLIMQSNGGTISLSAACSRPVATILSGPAGGAIAAKQLADAVQQPNVISFDMGGTSTDVSLMAGSLKWSDETTISGYPIAIPVIDIHTVGAGGGSIAYLDPGGALRVGPKSAGADPGPACYGKGELPTVTDANVVLGRISPKWLLGGDFVIDAERAEWAVGKLAAQMCMSAEEAAEGIVRVANATMQRALSVVSVQRGFDPRDFSIVAFGGAGPVHACDLCRAMRARSVIVPRHPGLFSAFGLLQADITRDYKKSVLMPAEPGRLAQLEAELAELEAQAATDLASDGIAPEQIQFQRRVEMRYVGQSYEIDLQFSESFLQTFDETYSRHYGYLAPDKPKEVVNIRVMAVVPSAQPREEKPRRSSSTKPSEPIGTQRLVEGGHMAEALLYRRDELATGQKLSGPAVVVEYSATTYLPDDFECQLDDLGNLTLSQAQR